MTDLADKGQPPARPAAIGAAAVSALAEHAAAVAEIRRAYAAIPAGQPVRLAKPTSNLFRFRGDSAGATLDVSAFDHVLHVDPAGPDGRRRRHDDLRGPGRRDARARPDAAGRARS